MAWPAWIVAALSSPQVRRVGIEVATRTGGVLIDRLAKKDEVRELAEKEEQVVDELEELRAAQDELRAMVGDVPTRHDLAEAFAALDEKNEERHQRLVRLTLIAMGAAVLIILAALLILR